MVNFSYDFHIHTCLSPCGDNDMTPANIIGMAALKGLEAVAITDHNSSLNCRAAMKLGEENGILVIPGMELTTEEEAHVLCLFYTLEEALAFSEHVYSCLQPVKNNPTVFGHQYICDEDENITGEIENLLINATSIGFSDVDKALKPYNGVMIPAHVDKSTTSVISNLGFIPPDSTFTTFECKKLTNLHSVRRDHPYLQKCNVITDSDAHYLWDINEAVNTINVSEKSIKGVLDYFRQGL
ncbi:MAG: PHP domain-containing protein [Lachnospiraceae bacterium]|nr:PHP domain-containing protein [Lachnospiraceae bacterium]